MIKNIINIGNINDNKTLEEIVPKDHMVRKVDEAIDLKFTEDEVEGLYSALENQVFLQWYFNKLYVWNKINEKNM